VFTPTKTGTARAKLGFDAYGADVAPPPSPAFTTVVMSAVKEHPIKTAAATLGVLALGAFLIRPGGALRR
jgi:hypothetical protein